MVGTIPKIVAINVLGLALFAKLCKHMPWWQAALVVNALIGLSLLQLSWGLVDRYLTKNEERDSHFPAFRRLDTHLWRKWMFVPGAMTIYIVRGLISLGSLFWLAMWLRIVMIGHEMGKNPLKGLRLWANFLAYKIASWLIIKASGITVTKHVVNELDYSKYLGKDYLKNQKLPKKASTIVANHQAWIDNIILIQTCYPGFAAKIETKKVPILNTLIDNLQSIYISRGGTEEQRNANLNEIVDRQKLVEKDPRYPQICIYPEGTQTNGTHLLNFKKGAFVGLNAVQPVIVKYSWKTFSPTWEGIPFIAHSSLQHMFLRTAHCDVYVLPPFLPNEYLFETHKDKGTEKWEIYAEAVREVMAEYGGFKLST